MNSIFSRLRQLEEEGKPAVLATVVESRGSTPRKPGARMIVFPDGSIEGTVGGGVLEKEVIENALQAFDSGETKLVHVSLRENDHAGAGGICGGEMRVFVEPISIMPRLLIFGGGHVGRTLTRMAQELKLRIVVYDDRQEFAQAGLFPPSTKTICGPFEEAMKKAAPTADDYIVIVSYEHKNDQQLLKDALDTPARYVGMIGSKKKCAKIRANLTGLGISQEQLDRVHAPIGLPIGGHTPAEIAVSILSQIVQVMNDKESN